MVFQRWLASSRMCQCSFTIVSHLHLFLLRIDGWGWMGEGSTLNKFINEISPFKLWLGITVLVSALFSQIFLKFSVKFSIFYIIFFHSPIWVTHCIFTQLYNKYFTIEIIWVATLYFLFPFFKEYFFIFLDMWSDRCRLLWLFKLNSVATSVLIMQFHNLFLGKI